VHCYLLSWLIGSAPNLVQEDKKLVQIVVGVRTPFAVESLMLILHVKQKEKKKRYIICTSKTAAANEEGKSGISYRRIILVRDNSGS